MLEIFGCLIMEAILYLAYRVGYEEGKNDEEEKQRLRLIKQMTGRDDENNK